MEIWKPISGLEGWYEVSNHGRVRSLTRTLTRSNGRRQTITGRIISQQDNGRGYRCVRLSAQSPKFTVKIHRIVAEQFVPNPEGKPEVNHLDGNKQNNRAENLVWATRSENMVHAYQNGLNRIAQARGEAHYATKITDDEARQIKSRALAGDDYAAIAADFRVSRSVVSNIKTGKRWQHVSV